jgi:hypothetical protein
MKIQELINELEGIKEEFGNIEVRGVEYDVEEGVYHLYNQTLFVTDTRNLVNDKYFVIDPDELGEYVLEIG